MACSRASLGSADLRIWELLEVVWQVTSQQCIDAQEPPKSSMETLVSLSRFTRNLVAEVAENQERALYRRGPSFGNVSYSDEPKATDWNHSSES